MLRKLIAVALCAWILQAGVAGLPGAALATTAVEARPLSLTLTVNSALDAVDANPGDGACATAGGACTLRAAVQETNAWTGADTIHLPAGIYRLTLVGPDEDQAATGDLDIRDHLTLIGADENTAIVDGIGADRVFQITTGVTGSPPIYVAISQITIRNGAVAGGGAGGGLFNNDEGRATLTHISVISNTATYGGGVFAHRSITITSSTIRENRAGCGGGIYNKFQTLTLIDSTVSGNYASYCGGGVDSFYMGSRAIISGSTISGNTADGVGGGIDIEDGGLELINSTVSGNTGGIFGAGGVSNNNSTYAPALIANSTIVSNSVPAGAGGLLAISPVVLRNSLIAHSLGGANCEGAITSEGYNLDSGASCRFTATGDLSNTLPLLGPLQDNGGATLTHALLAGSPAIDAGNPAPPGSGGTACEAVDQRGAARPAGAACDIGAFEFGGPAAVRVTGVQGASPPPWPAAWPAAGLALIIIALAGRVRRRRTEP